MLVNWKRKRNKHYTRQSKFSPSTNIINMIIYSNRSFRYESSVEEYDTTCKLVNIQVLFGNCKIFLNIRLTYSGTYTKRMSFEPKNRKVELNCDNYRSQD